MDITAHKGGKVTYHNPYIPTVKTNEGNVFNSVELTQEIINKADCIVLTTNHKNLNLNLIKSQAKLIVDMRNMVKEEGENIFKL
jgi:UDP-N-acetyl-D-glucosamine dehydrogenase